MLFRLANGKGLQNFSVLLSSDGNGIQAAEILINKSDLIPTPHFFCAVFSSGKFSITS